MEFTFEFDNFTNFNWQHCFALLVEDFYCIIIKLLTKISLYTYRGNTYRYHLGTYTSSAQSFSVQLEQKMTKCVWGGGNIFLYHTYRISILYSENSNIIFLEFKSLLLCFVEQMMFQYFVKIVPTTYVKIDGSVSSCLFMQAFTLIQHQLGKKKALNSTRFQFTNHYFKIH